jgi:hypothetical protein
MFSGHSSCSDCAGKWKKQQPRQQGELHMEDDKYFSQKAFSSSFLFWWLCKSFPIPKRQRPNREVKFHIIVDSSMRHLAITSPPAHASPYSLSTGTVRIWKKKKWNVNMGYNLRICQQRIYVIVTQLCSDEWNWNATICTDCTGME